MTPRPRRPVRHHDGDTGITLIEMVVSLSVLAIFLTIFTGATVSIYSTTNRAEALMDSSAQAHLAFNRLDLSVRYASAIGQPRPDTAGNPTVAFRSGVAEGTICTQLRVDQSSRQLQQRTWSVVDGGWDALTGWTVLASSVRAADGVAAFTLTEPGEIPRQQLTIRLVATSGPDSSASTAQVDATFVAFNSTEQTVPDGVCTEVSL